MINDTICYFNICLSKWVRMSISMLALMMFACMIYYLVHKIGFLEGNIE